MTFDRCCTDDKATAHTIRSFSVVVSKHTHKGHILGTASIRRPIGCTARSARWGCAFAVFVYPDAPTNVNSVRSASCARHSAPVLGGRYFCAGRCGMLTIVEDYLLCAAAVASC